jgi:hypothetical protein
MSWNGNNNGGGWGNQQPQQQQQGGWGGQPQGQQQQQFTPPPKGQGQAFPYQNLCTFTGQIYPTQGMPLGFIWKPPQNGQGKGRLLVNVKLRNAYTYQNVPTVRQSFVRLAIYGDRGQQMQNQLQTGDVIQFESEVRISNWKDQKTNQWKTSVEFVLGQNNQGAPPLRKIGNCPPIDEAPVQNNQGGNGGGWGGGQQAPQQQGGGVGWNNSAGPQQPQGNPTNWAGGNQQPQQPPAQQQAPQFGQPVQGQPQQNYQVASVPNGNAGGMGGNFGPPVNNGGAPQGQAPQQPQGQAQQGGAGNLQFKEDDIPF